MHLATQLTLANSLRDQRVLGLFPGTKYTRETFLCDHHYRERDDQHALSSSIVVSWVELKYATVGTLRWAGYAMKNITLSRNSSSR